MEDRNRDDFATAIEAGGAKREKAMDSTGNPRRRRFLRAAAGGLIAAIGIAGTILAPRRASAEFFLEGLADRKPTRARQSKPVRKPAAKPVPTGQKTYPTGNGKSRVEK